MARPKVGPHNNAVDDDDVYYSKGRRPRAVPRMDLEIRRILKQENVKLKQHPSNSEICTTSKRCSQAVIKIFDP